MTALNSTALIWSRSAVGSASAESDSTGSDRSETSTPICCWNLCPNNGGAKPAPPSRPAE